MKYVGIASSPLKTKLLRNWKRGKIREINTELLVAKDCQRHLSVLLIFDENNSCSGNLFKGTLYYDYQRSRGKSHKSITEKIEDFYSLYLSIKNRGYIYSKGYIKITTNGARIDGSHRSSILFYLKVPKIKVSVLNCKTIFSSRELEKFNKHLFAQKKNFT